MIGNINIPTSLIGSGGGDSIVRNDYCIYIRNTYPRWGSSSSAERLQSTNITLYIPYDVYNNTNSDPPYGFLYQVIEGSTSYMIFGWTMWSPERYIMVNNNDGTVITNMTGSLTSGVTFTMPFATDRNLTTTFRQTSRWDYNGFIFTIVNNVVSNGWTGSSTSLYLFAPNNISNVPTIDKGGTHVINF